MSLLLFSCSEKPKEQSKKNPSKKVLNQSVEQMAKRHMESQLSITATEKYSYQIYKAHLDDDEKIDAIITLNRLNFAMSEAASSKNTAKQAELGFMGNYNYIFFFDGGLNKISPPIAIPSSPLAELKIAFENIQSDSYKDILVDFRVLNASYKDYYTVANHIPRRVFQWKNYDGLKSETSEAYTFEYTDGTMGFVKDILVKKATLIQPSKDVDIYKYEPILKESDEVVYRFFYHPDQGKYMTQKKNMK
ncbi:MAG: hypothetical protein RI883_1606 [Bacteroidota bacterium]|jgi:hypothetical protein